MTEAPFGNMPTMVTVLDRDGEVRRFVTRAQGKRLMRRGMVADRCDSDVAVRFRNRGVCR